MTEQANVSDEQSNTESSNDFRMPSIAGLKRMFFEGQSFRVRLAGSDVDEMQTLFCFIKSIERINDRDLRFHLDMHARGVTERTRLRCRRAHFDYFDRLSTWAYIEAEEYSTGDLLHFRNPDGL
ncbi:hypothetical protein HOI18_03060 [Candidatus Uhrbacteria bacterium]|jgi:hypothetical protein|nr:hypothetical protein [Candidatus Uhrbacteria bacterium]